MTDNHHQPSTLKEALEQGYREVGDLASFLKTHPDVPKRETGACNPPPPDNRCLDTIEQGKHYVGFCVPGRGCVVTEKP